LLEARKKKKKEKLPDCYILLLWVAKNIYKMMIKNLCFIFDLWPDLAKSL
jgi:hypothetical protein